jgi:hypothetical protein
MELSKALTCPQIIPFFGKEGEVVSIVCLKL